MQAEKEYERCKAEYDKEKKELDKLYELQKQDRKEAFQYTENLSGDVYRLSLLFMEVLKKYLPDDVRRKTTGGISRAKCARRSTEYTGGTA